MTYRFKKGSAICIPHISLSTVNAMIIFLGTIINHAEIQVCYPYMCHNEGPAPLTHYHIFHYAKYPLSRECYPSKVLLSWFFQHPLRTLYYLCIQFVHSFTHSFNFPSVFLILKLGEISNCKNIRIINVSESFSLPV